MPLLGFPETPPYEIASTGIIKGGQLSINSGDNTKLDIAAGNGYIVDQTVDPMIIKPVKWDAKTAVTITNIATQPATDIAIDENGDVVQQLSFTSEELRNLIFLGGLDHSGNTVINNVFFIQIPANNVGSSLYELSKAVGDINIAGNVISPNGANLRIDKSVGSTFSYGRNNATDKLTPHTLTQPKQEPADLTYVFDNGFGEGVFDAATDINPNKYDDGSGTIANVPNNRWTIQRVLMFSNTGNLFVQYGTEVFQRLSDARMSLPTTTFKNLDGIQTALVRGFIIVRQGETALTSDDTVIIGADKFGGIIGSGGDASVFNEFVAGSFTPTVGLCPRVVPQYDWPIDNYSILVAFTPDGTDVANNYVLDMISDAGTGIQIRYTDANTIRVISQSVSGGSVRFVDVDITSAVANGYLVELVMRRKGTSADLSYRINSGTETIIGYSGSATFTDMAWPETVGLGSKDDGTDQIGAQLSGFKVANGQWYLATAGKMIGNQVPPTVVFDGREIYEDQTNIALIADSDQLSHGVNRGDLVFFYGGIIHSVQRTNYGLQYQSGTNADGDWLIAYDAAGRVVWRRFKVVANSSSSGPATVNTPITMGTTDYITYGSDTINTLIQYSSASNGNTNNSFIFTMRRVDTGGTISRNDVIIYGLEFVVQT